MLFGSIQIFLSPLPILPLFKLFRLPQPWLSLLWDYYRLRSWLLNSCKPKTSSLSLWLEDSSSRSFDMNVSILFNVLHVCSRLIIWLLFETPSTCGLTFPFNTSLKRFSVPIKVMRKVSSKLPVISEQNSTFIVSRLFPFIYRVPLIFEKRNLEPNGELYRFIFHGQSISPSFSMNNVNSIFWLTMISPRLMSLLDSLAFGITPTPSSLIGKRSIIFEDYSQASTV